MSGPLLFALVVGSCGPATPPPLGADAPPGAVSRYDIAKRLYREGNFAGAAAEFKAALAMHPVPKLAYNLARSAERANQLEAAVAAYTHYLKLAPGASDRKQVLTLIPILQERLRESHPEVALISTPPGAQIFVDGAKESLETPTPTTIRLKPGAHTVRFLVEGHHPLDRTIQVVADTPGALEGQLVRVAAEAVPVEPTGPSALHIAGWAAVGVGVVAAGVGAYAHAETFSLGDSADTEDLGNHAKQEDDFESAQVLMGVGYAAGGVLLVTGVVLLLLPDGSSPSVAAVPGGAGLGWRF